MYRFFVIALFFTSAFNVYAQQQTPQPDQQQQQQPDEGPQRPSQQPQQQPSQTQPDQQQQQPSQPATQQQPQTQQPAPPDSSSNPGPLPENPPPVIESWPGPGKHDATAFGGVVHYGFLSRMGIGADVSPLGVGIKGIVILTEKIDGRLMGNFFSFSSSDIDIDGTKATGTLHLASLVAAVDWYPRNSVWRLSPGVMLWNGNQISASGTEAGGTSFTLDGKTWFSSTANPASGSGVVGLHTNQPAFTISGGFGRFVPRSQRHWSFPAEYGVIFMGHPSLKITDSGEVCSNAAQTDCTDVNDISTAVGAEFNADLTKAEARWQRSLNRVSIYPIFSYGVVYSFNLRR